MQPMKKMTTNVKTKLEQRTKQELTGWLQEGRNSGWTKRKKKESDKCHQRIELQ